MYHETEVSHDPSRYTFINLRPALYPNQLPDHPPSARLRSFTSSLYRSRPSKNEWIPSDPFMRQGDSSIPGFVRQHTKRPCPGTPFGKLLFNFIGHIFIQPITDPAGGTPGRHDRRRKPMAGPEEIYQCQVINCGCMYDPDRGDRRGRISKGTCFSELPDDWKCPVCGAGKKMFRPLRGPGSAAEQKS